MLRRFGSYWRRCVSTNLNAVLYGTKTSSSDIEHRLCNNTYVHIKPYIRHLLQVISCEPPCTYLISNMFQFAFLARMRFSSTSTATSLFNVGRPWFRLLCSISVTRPEITKLMFGDSKLLSHTREWILTCTQGIGSISSVRPLESTMSPRTAYRIPERGDDPMTSPQLHSSPLCDICSTRDHMIQKLHPRFSCPFLHTSVEIDA